MYSSRPSVSTPRSSTQISVDGDAAAGHTISYEQTRTDSHGNGEDEEATARSKGRLRHRQMIIKELIDTEAVYLKDMNVVEEIYKGTAEACPKLDAGDIKAIFRNTDQIVAFSTLFLDDLKAASASVYSPRSQKSRRTTNTSSSPMEDRSSNNLEESDWAKDQKTFVGSNFRMHIEQMRIVYTEYLKSSEQASSRLVALQSDAAVKVWLGECNLVAKDLTAAWDLDALLVKPVQRVTRYQLLLQQLRDKTPEDHPDYEDLCGSCEDIKTLLEGIDDLKRRIMTVSKIVGRKRKESDVRTNLTKTSIAKAFHRRDKAQTSHSHRSNDDETYVRLHDKFGDDFLRLQVVLRDVEFYTRQAANYVNDFLRYLSAIELVMRVSASQYPELESKWARFNMSMRDMGTIALEDHVSELLFNFLVQPFRGLYFPGFCGAKAGHRAV